MHRSRNCTRKGRRKQSRVTRKVEWDQMKEEDERRIGGWIDGDMDGRMVYKYKPSDE